MSANCNTTSLRDVLRYWPFAFSLLTMACASTPRLFEFHFTQESFSSSDGKLRYKLPLGWINATPDAPSADNLIWAVRSDYAAMLVVREVTIDDITRRGINKEGLGRLGELMLALASSENGVRIVKQPSGSVVGGIPACTYEYTAGHPGSRVHVVLVDTGSRVYEVSARTADTMGEEASKGIIALQEAFVGQVSW